SGHVERDAEPGLAVTDEILEPAVRVLGAAESGEHPHRPQATAVHRRVDAAGEGELAGLSEPILVRLPREIEGRVQPFHGTARGGEKFRATFGEGLQGLPEGRLLPPFQLFVGRLPLFVVPHVRLGGYQPPAPYKMVARGYSLTRPGSTGRSSPRGLGIGRAHV